MQCWIYLHARKTHLHVLKHLDLCVTIDTSALTKKADARDEKNEREKLSDSSSQGDIKSTSLQRILAF